MKKTVISLIFALFLFIYVKADIYIGHTFMAMKDGILVRINTKGLKHDYGNDRFIELRKTMTIKVDGEFNGFFLIYINEGGNRLFAYKTGSKKPINLSELFLDHSWFVKIK